MRAPMIRALLLVALGLMLVSLVLGCPTIKIRSLTVDSFKKNVAVLSIEIEVDNTADDADSSSSKVAVALPAGWELLEVTYRIPGEPLDRRARPLPGLAVQADWVYEFEGGVWWGFDTAEHAVPAGVNIYPMELRVQVPRKTRDGRLAMVVGDPGPDTEVAAFAFELKGKREVTRIEAPAINPASQIETTADALDMEGMMAGLGEGLAALGEGLEGVGEAGTMMRQLGTMFGVETGAPGYREDWITAQMDGAVFRMSGAALDIPEGWSAMGDPPTDETIQMVLMPPGATTFLGVRLVPGVDAASAAELFEAEVGKANGDLAAEGTPAAISEITRTTPGGRAVQGRQLRVVTEGDAVVWTMVRLAEGDHLAMVVTSGDAAQVEGAVPLIDRLLDSIRFE